MEIFLTKDIDVFLGYYIIYFLKSKADVPHKNSKNYARTPPVTFTTLKKVTERLLFQCRFNLTGGARQPARKACLQTFPKMATGKMRGATEHKFYPLNI